jgi:hypothetical protein
MSMCHTAFVTEIRGRGTRHAQDSYRVLGMIAEPTGTDGHRTIGRTWHVSRLKNSALVEAISWSTMTMLPLHHHETIRSALPLTLRDFCLCLDTLKLHLILAGRSRYRNGEPCSSESSRGNRSVTSHGITACRMRRSGVCCVPRIAAKWDV